MIERIEAGREGQHDDDEDDHELDNVLDHVSERQLQGGRHHSNMNRNQRRNGTLVVPVLEILNVPSLARHWADPICSTNHWSK